MENVKNFFRNKNVQYFLSFCSILLAFWISIYPLLDSESPMHSSQNGMTMVSEDTHEDEIQQNNEKFDQTLVTQIAVAKSENSVKLYQEPNNQQFPIAELKKGNYLLVLKKVNDEWLQVQFNQQVAWMPTKDVLLTHLISGYSNESISLYKEANIQSQVITSIPNGQVFYLIDESEPNFSKILYNGQEGYVSNNHLNYAVDHINDMIKLQSDLPQTLNAKKILVTKLKETPLYESTNIFSKRISTVNTGTVFHYEDRENDFYKVSIGNNKKAYIPYWLVNTNFAAIETDSQLPQGIEHAKIVIDPGHGGDDPGAVVTFSDKHEADHTLTTALLLKKELETLGATVLLTRDSDKSVSLEDRALLSNQENANAFISLHFDSGPNATVSGTTAYYYSDTSENLALTVNKYISKNLPIKSQGTKFQNFLVLRENKQPSILLELGYLNNPEDNQLIETTEYQENIAKSIASALKEYFQQ